MQDDGDLAVVTSVTRSAHSQLLLSEVNTGNWKRNEMRTYYRLLHECSMDNCCCCFYGRWGKGLKAECQGGGMTPRYGNNADSPSRYKPEGGVVKFFSPFAGEAQLSTGVIDNMHLDGC